MKISELMDGIGKLDFVLPEVPARVRLDARAGEAAAGVPSTRVSNGQRSLLENR